MNNYWFVLINSNKSSSTSQAIKIEANSYEEAKKEVRKRKLGEGVLTEEVLESGKGKCGVNRL